MTDQRMPIRNAWYCGTSLLALCVASSVQAQTADTAQAEQFVDGLEQRGSYLSGDKHNHTTCTDGTTSVRTLVDRSLLVYDLDWFAQTGHGGSGSRDCRFDDIETGSFVEGIEPPTFPENATANLQLERSNPRKLWVDTIGQDALKGDDAGDRMWRWQSLIEYAYPSVAVAGQVADKTTWLGVETIVPGHEHTSMGVLGDQFRTAGDAYATGQFEYLWDGADNDFSGGEEYDFEDPSNNGVPKQENEPGIAGHLKSVDSVEWLRANHRTDSYYVPAHVERQGAFVDDENRGYNVEHLRDYHNAGLFDPADVTGPSMAFGGEFAPGHQFQTDRGSYSLGRPTAGFGTYGGAGAYGAAEVSLPGFDFDGAPVTDETLAALNETFAAEFGGNPLAATQIELGEPQQRYVFGRPGVRTLWDAMLGEGRRYFIFFSSDWHNRGAFGPFEPHSTNDAWPGEYQKIWAYARGSDGGYNYAAARSIVSGMRAGNSYSVMGDLIEDLAFVMCQGTACATMGETLTVDPAGEDIVYYVRFTDPEGVNYSPYSFDNPSLLQIGRNVPLNAPVLDNIDIIRGDITGPIAPGTPEYSSANSNPTTEIFTTAVRDAFTDQGEGVFSLSGSIPADSIGTDMYFRMRGTNMPKGTPNETTPEGNPLLDAYANNIPCPFPYVDPDPETADIAEFNPAVCPAYMPVNAGLGTQIIDFDVESWTDLWFYANPIFVEVRS